MTSGPIAGDRARGEGEGVRLLSGEEIVQGPDEPTACR